MVTPTRLPGPGGLPLRRIGRPLIVGHRGAPRIAQENTPDAFAAAAASGADWVELDVRRSADGLVVTHDPFTADGTAVVQRSTKELRAYGIADLPTVLEAMPDRLGVNAELKNLPGEPDDDLTDRIAVEVAPLLEEAARWRPLFASSFNPATLGTLAQHAPELPLGLLFASTVAVETALRLAVELGAETLCCPDTARGLDAEFIDASHRAGFSVMVWTVDDVRRARTLAGLGVDAICTNDPAALAAELQS